VPAIPCPHCGSTATLPLPGLGDRPGAVFGAAFARRASDLSFGNPGLAQRFHAGENGAYGRGCRRRFTRKSGPSGASPAPSVTRRLADLEQLRAEGLISEAEYQSKRNQIINEL
jgi:hypothetical protein